jgi:HTH-type transcriptional regulator/antitoxin HigA
MNIRPLKTEDDYKSALGEIEGLFDAEPGTPDADRLEVLVTLVEAYENAHFPIPLPDPIEAIKFRMEAQGLTRVDLEPFIGSRARVSEILNKRRHLTLEMIRKLERGLGIPSSVLVQDYDLASESEEPSLSENLVPLEGLLIVDNASVVRLPPVGAGVLRLMSAGPRNRDALYLARDVLAGGTPLGGEVDIDIVVADVTPASGILAQPAFGRDRGVEYLDHLSVENTAVLPARKEIAR